MVLVNVVGCSLFIVISFILGWWFIRKQTKYVSEQVLRTARQEVKKEVGLAKKQLLKISRTR